MTEAVNPYAAPAARVEDVGANPEAESIRLAHINHEASIKAVGALYYLGGILVTLSGLVMSMNGDFMYLLLFLGLGATQLAAGWGVRALEPWGRILASVLAAPGLLAFPFGTLISAYILYLFLAKKGRTIFTPDYRAVIAATLHVKYRTSMVVWIFLALLIGLFAAALLIPMLSK